MAEGMNKTIDTQIGIYQEQLLKARTSNAETKKEIEAKERLVQMLKSTIRGLEMEKDMLDLTTNSYKKAADAINDFNNVGQSLNEAKAAFNRDLQAMATAFNNFKKELKKGVDQEIRAIKDSIDKLKESNDAFQEAKDKEIEAIQETSEAVRESTDKQIQAIHEKRDAAIAAIDAQLSREQQQANDRIALIETQRRATASMWKAAQTSQAEYHSKTMASYDRELAAIDRLKAATNSRYDEALNGLRALTPAEKQLKNLELSRLQAQAQQGGEEGLRAKAQLERMVREEQVAELQKQKAKEIEALEARAEAIKEGRRRKDEEHQKKMAELAEQAAQADKKYEEDKAALNADQKQREEDAETRKAAVKKKAEDEEKRLHEERMRRLKALDDQEKEIQEQKEQRDKETAERVKKREEEIKALKDKHNKDLETEEKRYNKMREDFLVRYRQAIGEAHNDIVTNGATAWGNYAKNAIANLAQVEAAARRAAIAAAAARNSGRGRPGAWTGGPVSGGTTYTVNELGKEAFLSKSGELSMINAPAFGAWRPPTSGTVINAAMTQRLGLPDAIKQGAAISPTGGRAAANASGSETRNLLRAIAKATGGDNITNNVTIQAANTTQAASDMMVELTKIKRRRLR